MIFLKFFRRIVKGFLLFLLFNCVFLFAFFGFPLPLKICAATALFAFYLYFNVNPYTYEKRSGQRRMRILMGGRECILMAMPCFLLELLLYSLIIFSVVYPSAQTAVLIINAVVFVVLISVLVINGFARIFITAKQAGILLKLLFFFFWWVPVLNIVLLKKLSNSAIREYVFTVKKADLNESRRHKELCRTKYPLLLVHGVFWRDWENRNYWGRIPKELEVNGAACYYGNNKSSASIEESGVELADRIQSIVSETGCEKLNIIAHSKGGLDCRYAISCMGMGKYTASLTTICTPHYGCNSIRKLVERIPNKAMHYINKKYKTLYSILGDENPDFLSGLAGITDTVCAALNEKMPDDPNVYYQSVAAKMKSRKSAAFPLNLGYELIKPTEGDNDGLVAVNSMAWGNFLGVVSPAGKQGISHGDIIDLTRMNIEGFDVFEFYVSLVNSLKERGF